MLLRLISLKIKIFAIASLICALIVVGSFLWVMSAPRSFGWIKSYVEEQLSNASETYNVRIGKGLLIWDGFDNAFSIRIEEMQVVEQNNQVVAVFPEVKLGLSMSSLLRGSYALSSLNIVKPSFHLSLGEASLDKAKHNHENLGDFMLLLSPILEKGKWNLDQLPERIRITEGMLHLNNGKNIFAWQMPQAYFVTGEQERKIEFTIDFGNTSSLFSLESREEENSKQPLLIAAVENFPSYILPDLFPDLTILHGIDVIAGAKITTFFDSKQAVEHIEVEVSQTNGNISLKDYFPDTLSLRDFNAIASYYPHTQLFNIKNLEAKFPDVTVTTNGTIQNLAASWQEPNIVMDTELHLQEIETDMLALYWPIPLGVEARTWVTSQMRGGKVLAAKGRFVINEGEYGVEPYPAKMIDALVEFEDVDVILPAPLPIAKKAKGKAFFDGVHMTVTVDSASILKSHISEASVVIPDWWKEPVLDLQIKAKTDGNIADILNIAKRYVPDTAANLEDYPFSLYNIQEESGQAQTEVSVSLPLDDEIKEEQIAYEIKSNLTNASAQNVLDDIDMKNGTLAVLVTPEVTNVEGVAILGSILTEFNINQPNQKQADVNYSLKLKGTVEELKSLGFEKSIPYLKDQLVIEVAGKLANTSHSFKGSVDGKNASVIIPALGYSKAKAVPWMLEFDAVQQKNGIIDIVKAAIVSPNFNVKATAQLNAKNEINQLEAKSLAFDSNRLDRVFYKIENGTRTTSIRGKKLDLSKAKLGNFLQSFSKSDTSVNESSFHMELDNLMLNNDGVFNDVKATMQCEKSFCYLVDIFAKIKNENYFVANLKPSSGKHTLMLESDNAGAVINALDISKHVKGGRLEMQAVLERQNDYTKADGILTIRDFIAVKTPLLGKLLTLASFSGIRDLLEGKGINFQRFEAPFVYQNGVITINDARSSGASVGITAEGTIDTNTSQMNISGSVVPAQAVNTLVNKIPLVGTMITGGESQGVIAASYSIKGSVENAETSVNPLSIITPGILRKLFDIIPDSPIENVPKEVIEPSTDAEKNQQEFDKLWENKSAEE